MVMLTPVINLLATILLREYYHVLQTSEGTVQDEVDDEFMHTFLRNVHQHLLQQWEAFILERSSRFKGHAQAQSSMQQTSLQK